MTFVRDEPVHPVGMPFPGVFKIKYENGYILLSGQGKSER
ncbi:MAG: DUF2115 family protein [Methanobacterium sp.]